MGPVPGPYAAVPAVARVRRAVRAVLSECDDGDLVLVACSGGVDSLALAVATAAEAPRLGLRVGAVVVDHGLQAGSAGIAADVGRRLRALGLDPVEVVGVDVGRSPAGPEADARTARHAALDVAATRLGAALVLLGHTRDDQAEQVLLGLARGSGARSLSGMPAARGRLRRPVLGLPRTDLVATCGAHGLAWWDDPMNADPSFARVRAGRAVADLEDVLGPGVAAALARTADQLRVDADHLDSLADEAVVVLGDPPWAAATLTGLPLAVRSRWWRRALVAAGAPAGQLSSRHTDACDRLLTHWHGQGPVHVPGTLLVRRLDGRVSVAARPPVE